MHGRIAFAADIVLDFLRSSGSMLSALDDTLEVVDIVDALCPPGLDKRINTSFAALQNPTGISENVEWPQCRKT